MSIYADIDPTDAAKVFTPQRAWLIFILRLGGLFICCGVIWLILNAVGFAPFPLSSLWNTLAILPINVLCFMLLRRWFSEVGLSLKDALGVRLGRISKDIVWGVLWVFATYIPFVVALTGAVFLFYGSDAPAAFETIFTPTPEETGFPPAIMLVVALIVIIPFIAINAITEELAYRGFVTTALAPRFGLVGAYAVSTLFFGLQHIFFATSPLAVPIFFIAFTVWGAVAAIIVHRQNRLLPITIAHWVTNFVMSVPGIVIPIAQLAGAM